MSFLIDRAFVRAYHDTMKDLLAMRIKPWERLSRQLYADLRMAEIEFWDAVERSMAWHARRA